MRWMHTLDAPAERLVAVGRVLFGVAVFAALATEPAGTFPRQGALVLLSAVYLGYAFLSGLTGLIHQFGHAGYRAVTHGLDVAFALVLLWIAGDVGTELRVFGTFAILAAGLRFGSRVIAATTAAILTMFTLVSLYTGPFLEAPDFHPLHVAVGTAFFLMLAVALSHLKIREERIRRDLGRLASWPRTPIAEMRELLRETLEHAALVLRAPTAILVWEESEEPYLHIARWSGGEFRLLREPPHRFDPLVDPVLEGEPFYSRDIRRRAPVVVYRRESSMLVRRGCPIHTELLALLPEKSLLSVCVKGESVEGRLFLGGGPTPNADGLLTAEVVADLIAARLDQGRSINVSKSVAVSEERVRLARDLHDGLLQSLTGVALHLQSAERLIPTAPDAAIRSLVELQEVIVTDQRGLRAFIQQLRPFPNPAYATLRLTGRLEDLGARFQNQFGLAVSVRTESLAAMVSEEMRHEIFSIVNEALANAAKHAGASNVTVDLQTEGEHIRIVVVDDGRGFPFHGTYDLRQLSEMRRGPLTLKERILSLGGELTIISGENGATLDIRVPRATGV